MTNQLELTTSRSELRPRLLLNGVSVFTREGIPQSTALVIGVHVPNLDSDQFGGRDADSDRSRGVIDGDVGIVAKIDAGKESSGNDDERTLGRAVPGILVDDDVTNSCFARDELRHRANLLDYYIVAYVRGVAAEKPAGHESTGAVAETHQDQQRDCDQNGTRANNSAWLFLW